MVMNKESRDRIVCRPEVGDQTSELQRVATHVRQMLLRLKAAKRAPRRQEQYDSGQQR
jgi:hypothetical protein